MSTPPVVVTVAGTDSGGGAGVAADLATFAALGVHGACVVTAVTAQDTTGVHTVHLVPLDTVRDQLDAVLADLRPAVIKTGMLGSAPVVALVARRFLRYRERVPGARLVVDPVLRATTGARLADAEVVRAYREELLPVATVATPNAAEDAALGHARAGATIVTGSGGADEVFAGGERFVVPGPRVATSNDHGTGCTHASALAALLAHGADLRAAATGARRFVTHQLDTSRSWSLGHGRGPIAHTVATSEAPPPRGEA